MSNRLFNTPFELSLHVVMLLDIVDAAVTLDRIAAYDFIAIYSGDFAISKNALNGENGFAFSELSARRKLIKAALKDLVAEVPGKFCQVRPSYLHYRYASTRL